ncbi:MAG: ComEC/Rec2 family competence protein [Eubacteriales bacterium]|nr:ComEC/Rec2 family competence protein [Eubacteriales bacterium]
MERNWNDPSKSSPEYDAPKRKSRILLITALLVLLLLFVAGLLILRGIDSAQTAILPPVTSSNSEIPTVTPTPAASSAPVGLRVTFLDVGQGDCAFLESPSGKTMLIDGGPESAFPAIDTLLTQRGVSGLDVVIASHLHADHIGGLIQVIDAYPVGIFYDPPFDAESEVYFELLDAIQENHVVTASPLAGADTLLPWDASVEVRVLAPYQTVYSDFNDTSYILRISYGETSVLFTGDATALGEKLALKALPNRYFHANVLKIGHHGSSDSTSEKFLETVAPSLAVISVGKGNEYGLPDQELLDRLKSQGITVLRTDEDGTVTLLLDGTNVTVVK